MSLLPSSTTGDVVVLVGHPSTGSRTGAVGRTVADQLTDEPGARAHVVELGELGTGPLGEGGVAVQEAEELVRHAGLLVVAAPVFKAGYPGILKLFLDRLEPTALESVVAVPVVLTASSAHGALADLQLRVVLQAVGRPAARAVVRARGAPPRRSPAVRRRVAGPLRNGGRRGRPGAERRRRCTPDERRPSRRGPAGAGHRRGLPLGVPRPRCPGGRGHRRRWPGAGRVHRHVVDVRVDGAADGLVRGGPLGICLAHGREEPTGSAYTSWPTTRTGSPRRSPPAASTASRTCAGTPDLPVSRSSRTAPPSCTAPSSDTSLPVTTCSCSPG